jgi:hypothetical protein
MRQIDTNPGRVPVTTQAGLGYSRYRGAPKAAFISQLIAEKHHFAGQRARRRAPIEDALQSYDAAGRIAVRRMPAGYRLDIEA